MEKVNANAQSGATVSRKSDFFDLLSAKGKYTVECHDKDGNFKWKDTIDNVVTDVGANQLLNSAFGAGPVAGPYLGLISSVGYTGIPVVGDTMSSHASVGHVWVEAGNGTNYPKWSTPASNARGTMTFGAAAARAAAITPIAFTIATNAGTVEGCFVVLGTSAVATNNDTNGVLLSAGIFTGGAKVVDIADTLTVSYSLSIS
jgi:hypothetical protein